MIIVNKNMIMRDVKSFENANIISGQPNAQILIEYWYIYMICILQTCNNIYISVICLSGMVKLALRPDWFSDLSGP